MSAPEITRSERVGTSVEHGENIKHTFTLALRDTNQGYELSFRQESAGIRGLDSCGPGAPTLTGESPYYEAGWSASRLETLAALSKRWHLNGLKAGCEHQRLAKWESFPIDPSKPLNAYGKHIPGKGAETWNMLTWVRRSEHPEGLLLQPCPTCGYKYGSSWLHETLPDAVLEWAMHFVKKTETPEMEADALAASA